MRPERGDDMNMSLWRRRVPSSSTVHDGQNAWARSGGRWSGILSATSALRWKCLARVKITRVFHGKRNKIEQSSNASHIQYENNCFASYQYLTGSATHMLRRKQTKDDKYFTPCLARRPSTTHVNVQPADLLNDYSLYLDNPVACPSNSARNG